MTQTPRRVKAKNLIPLKEPPANEPAKFDDIHIHALQALRRGEATPHQQKAALEWIVNQASRTHKPHYHVTDRDTNFALGRAFVGQQIVGLLAIELVNFEIDRSPPPSPDRDKPQPKEKS